MSALFCPRGHGHAPAGLCFACLLQCEQDAGDVASLRALAPEVESASIEGEVIEAPVKPARRVLVGCVSRIAGVFRNYRVVMAQEQG